MNPTNNRKMINYLHISITTIKITQFTYIQDNNNNHDHYTIPSSFIELQNLPTLVGGAKFA